MRIIGLCGPAGSGKDTVANIATTFLFRKKVIRHGFADKLKLSAARLFKPDANLEEALAFCNWLKDHGCVIQAPAGGLALAEAGFDAEVDGRPFLQRYGTEGHREVFGDDFWLDEVLPTELVPIGPTDDCLVETTRNDCDVLLVPDVRFPNEVNRVLEVGGELWKVDRPSVAPIATAGHASESGVDDSLVTLTVRNHGSKSDLRSEVQAILMDRDLLA